MSEQKKDDDAEVLREFEETLNDISSRASDDDIVSNGSKRIVLISVGVFGVFGGILTAYIGQFDLRLLALGIIFLAAGIGLILAAFGNRAFINKSFEEFLDSL